MKKIKLKPFSPKQKIVSKDLDNFINALGSNEPEGGFKVTIAHKGQEVSLPLDDTGAQKLNDMITQHVSDPTSGWERGLCPGDASGCVDFTSPVNGDSWHKIQTPPPAPIA